MDKKYLYIKIHKHDKNITFKREGQYVRLTVNH